VGGVLLAWVLGPGLGAWAMAIVLAVQALVLGDGGLAALGANVLNMALLPAGSVAVCLQLKLAEGRWSSAACAAAAALSVPLAALLIVGQTALFRASTELVGWPEFAYHMLTTHFWIGLAEGGLTLSAVGAIAWLGAPQRALAARAACLALVAFAVAAFPWSSSLPDGYESAAQAAGLSAWLTEGAGALLSHPMIGEQGSLLLATLLAGLFIAALATIFVPRQPVPGPCS
jgi:cobalt/nickel transport system permease protein